jgi:hypothetical protein
VEEEDLRRRGRVELGELRPPAIRGNNVTVEQRCEWARVGAVGAVGATAGPTCAVMVVTAAVVGRSHRFMSARKGRENCVGGRRHAEQ